MNPTDADDSRETAGSEAGTHPASDELAAVRNFEAGIVRKPQPASVYPGVGEIHDRLFERVFGRLRL
jgi:hypothetical protein